jgi:TonB-dependent receptor
MKTGNKFKYKYLTSLLMLNMGITGAVVAAENNEKDEDTEVIVVSGIRGSLINSQNLKQDAANVVDAITAEDIGKFPDQNVAESLQRITGVSIDRSGGEGELITVRGMGPEFNSVLLNGRTLATTSGGRAFSFDVLASELISGADVHKTQSAEVQEGSIGATVDISTVKPLDFDGFKAVGSIKGQYDDMTGKTNPTYSGLISNTFDDGKFGVLASFASYKRESRYDQANTSRYFKWDSSHPDKRIDGQDYGEVYFPRNYDQIAQTETRERNSGTLVLQYQPTDDLRITADALYSKLNVKYRQDVFPMWFTPWNIENPVFDENNTLVKGDFVDAFIETLVRQSDADDTVTAVGLNLDFDATENWSMQFDVSMSEAEHDPGKGWSDVVAGRPGDFSYDRSSGSLLPTMTFENFKEGDVLTAGWASLQGTRVKDEVLEAKFDNQFVLDAGPLVQVDFGLHYSDRTLGSTYGETENPLPWTFSDNSTGRIPLPADMLWVYDADGFLSGGSGNPTQMWPTLNSDDLFAFLSTEEAISQLGPDEQATVRDIMTRGGFAMVDNPEAYEVNEELTSVYTNFHLEGEVSDMPWAVVAGLRYVETTSTSIGQQISLISLEEYVDPVTNKTLLRPDYSDDYQNVSVGHSYEDVLPSLNGKLELTDDVIVRLAWSKSITRPELDEMSPVSSYGGGEATELSGSGANPKLMPYESTNIDYSLEWYYEEGSYAAIAGFSKDVEGYLTSGTTNEIVTLPSGDYNYTMSRRINGESTKIDGVEIAVQHMFSSLPAPFDGLGVIANMTFVDSESSEKDVEEKLPLIGLGDSQNLILFYEKGPVQFRIAYNNRDRFLQSKPYSSTYLYSSWNIDGHYVDDYAQVDISGSYDINDNLTVFFEGINITNELYIKNAEFDNQTLTVTETGPRYAVGIRSSF